jgi:exodeoxyribonuclease VII large subunit
MDDSFEFVFTPQRTVSDGMLTPSQVVRTINQTLKGIEGTWLEGEVQGYRGAARSGHHYFEIADEDKFIPAIIWKGRWASATAELGGRLANGQIVQCRFSKVDMHNGKVSLHLDKIRLTGEGELLRRRQETLALLRAQGFCEPSRRRPLPWLPREIAIIAGHNSDAMADVSKAIRDRWPLATLRTQAAAMQGNQAVGSIIDAIGALQSNPNVDVIVVARGGGSVQDLAPYDDERLCKAIATCPLPVVVSIGHTPNKPNVYAVADASADVPGKVAQLLVPDMREVLAAIDRSATTIVRAANAVAGQRERLEDLAALLQDPGRQLSAHVEALDHVEALQNAKSTQRLADIDRALDHQHNELQHAHRHVPSTQALDQQALLLSEQSHRFFTERTATLDSCERRLHSGVRHVPSPDRLNADHERLRASMRLASAQLSGHAATIKSAGDARYRQAQRQLGTHSELLDVHGHNAGRRAERSMTRLTEHLEAELRSLGARDWQGRGYALITSADGTPMTTVDDFTTGDVARIELADGIVETTVTNTEST